MSEQETETVVVDETKQLTRYQRFATFLPDKLVPELAKVWMKKIDFDSDRFVGVTLNLIRRKPEIMACEPMSILSALRQCAEFSLYPDELRGLCWIIPRYDKNVGQQVANFQLGYQGVITLFRRSGYAIDGKCVESSRVYKGEVFEMEKGLQPVLRYVPNPDLGMKDRELRLVYAICYYKEGQPDFDSLTTEELAEVERVYAKAKSGPWTQSDLSRSWMEKKTVIRQVLKLSPAMEDQSLSYAIALDEKVDANVSQGLNSALEGSQAAMAAQLLSEDGKAKISVPEIKEATGSDSLDEFMQHKEAKPVAVDAAHNKAPEDEKKRAKPEPVDEKELSIKEERAAIVRWFDEHVPDSKFTLKTPIAELRVAYNKVKGAKDDVAEAERQIETPAEEPKADEGPPVDTDDPGPAPDSQAESPKETEAEGGKDAWGSMFK